MRQKLTEIMSVRCQGNFRPASVVVVDRDK